VSADFFSLFFRRFDVFFRKNCIFFQKKVCGIKKSSIFAASKSANGFETFFKKIRCVWESAFGAKQQCSRTGNE
jgi:hypothetical protein